MAETGQRPGKSGTSGSGTVSGVVIGVLVAIDESGRPLVAYPGNPDSLPRAARFLGAVTHDAIGREVALMFENGDIAAPMLVGVVESSVAKRESPASDATIDGRRVVLEGHDEVVLRCGKASITLTRAGKVLIRGAYVSNRSSGANRIKGGSVQIN